MKTTPSPIAPTFVSPGLEVDVVVDVVVVVVVVVDADVLVDVVSCTGAATAGAVDVIEDEDEDGDEDEDEDGDGAPGTAAFFPCPSGITSLGEVGQGTGALSCAHATRAAARCRYTTTPSPTRAPTTRAPGSRRVTG